MPEPSLQKTPGALYILTEPVMVIDLKFIDEDKCVLTGPNGYLQKHSIIMYLGTRLRVFPWQEHIVEGGRFYTFLFNERCVGFHGACSEDLGLFQPFSEPVLEGR